MEEKEDFKEAKVEAVIPQVIRELSPGRRLKVAIQAKEQEIIAAKAEGKDIAAMEQHLGHLWNQYNTLKVQ